MAFVNLSLLFGVGLTAVPIVLHLLLRPRPKHVLFPAVRFLKSRQRTTQRTLQLRHWLLLALRCAVILALAAALARPSVASTAVGHWLANGLVLAAFLAAAALAVAAGILGKGRPLVIALAVIAAGLLLGLTLGVMAAFRTGRGIVVGDEQAPVAAALVFDTAPRMDYQFQNQTRLQTAQEIARWLLKQFPADSDVAVWEGQTLPPVFMLDRAAAEKAVERLQTVAAARPLDAALREAVDLLLTSDKSRRELFLFTDLSRAAWSPAAERLRTLLAEHADLVLYVIDVGAADPRNIALGDLQLGAETVVADQPLSVRVPLRSLGVQERRGVELLIEEPDARLPIVENGQLRLPTEVVRTAREYDVRPDAGEQIVEFHVRGLPPGVHQGRVRLVGTDGLPHDDVRYFTFSVRPAWPVLLAAGPDVASELFAEAVAPGEFRTAGEAQFACETIAQSELINRDVKSYAAVVLLDPKPLTPTDWERLHEYVRSGGGLAVFLGRHADPPVSFQIPSARRLLGGKLARVLRAGGGGLRLAPERFDHQVLAPFAEAATSVPWDRAPVFRHWMFDELDADAQTVLRFSNGQPALVETAVERGRVLTMTTPVTEPLQPSGRAAWNEISANEEAWPFVVLANESLRYLVGTADVRLNFQAGETVVLPNDEARDPARYVQFTPREPPRELLPRDNRLTIRFTDRAGAYRLKGDQNGPVVRGFAVNMSAAATDLTKLPRKELDALLGESRYQLARTREEITLEVGEARRGREFFAHLIVICAVLLGLEQLLANRFYAVPGAAAPAASPRSLRRSPPAPN